MLKLPLLPADSLSGAEPRPTVTTALGPVDTAHLGVTLMHEHTFINFTKEFPTDGLLVDAELMRSEVELFKLAGGGTIVDLSAAELTRGASPDPGGRLSGESADSEWEHFGSRAPSNVRAIRDLAMQTGVNIVLGTGHYRESYFDVDFIDHRSTDELAEQMVRDLTEGFPGSGGVRAGIIGEIGCDRWFITEREMKSFIASAKAHAQTGHTISTHALTYPVGLEQLDVLISEGVAPEAVIVGHCDTVNSQSYHSELALRGAWVQFDTLRGSSERETERRVDHVMRMVRAGHIEQILLSHDVAKRSHLTSFGGNGYTFILDEFVHRLWRRGMNSEETDQILCSNPARALLGMRAA